MENYTPPYSSQPTTEKVLKLDEGIRALLRTAAADLESSLNPDWKAGWERLQAEIKKLPPAEQ